VAANIQLCSQNKNSKSHIDAYQNSSFAIMKFAAIDIGSNAIRLQITKVLEFDGVITFKKLQYIRFPLRLGHDVFEGGRIGEKKQVGFMRLMTAYKNMIDLYEVDHCYGCATSAMRESTNGRDLVNLVQELIGLEINIISGKEEAELINKVISLNLEDQAYLHIDVGGGSTELNVYKNQKKIESESFPIGSVRLLDHKENPDTWIDIENWVKNQFKGHKGKLTAIGTGGNINKIYELCSDTKKRMISLNNILKTQEYLKTFSFEEKLNRLQLNPDRADVIVPASEIYIQVMKAAKASKMYVPDVGLKDGINYYMFETYYPTRGKVFVKNH
jgi:exopolyphosphatase/guanosine-5'-triphosphate,3'-diphosphate pyrophosphatase